MKSLIVRQRIPHSSTVGGTTAFGINQRYEEDAAVRRVNMVSYLNTPNLNSHLKINKEVSIINVSYNMN